MVTKLNWFIKELIKESKNNYVNFYHNYFLYYFKGKRLINFGLWILTIAFIIEAFKKPQNYDRIILIVLMMINSKLSLILIKE